MNTPNMASTIADLAAPLAASLGLEIWGVEYAKGAKSLIRVYAEGAQGIDIDQCAELSRLLGLTLDAENCIQEVYVLEVSSPGLERTFFTAAQLRAFTGKSVNLTLHVPVPHYPGRKNFTGTLLGEENGRFSVLPSDPPGPGQEPAQVFFAWEDVKKISLAHFFSTPSAKHKTGTGKSTTPGKQEQCPGLGQMPKT